MITPYTVELHSELLKFENCSIFPPMTTKLCSSTHWSLETSASQFISLCLIRVHPPLLFLFILDFIMSTTFLMLMQLLSSSLLYLSYLKKNTNPRAIPLTTFLELTQGCSAVRETLKNNQMLPTLNSLFTNFSQVLKLLRNPCFILLVHSLSFSILAISNL